MQWHLQARAAALDVVEQVLERAARHTREPIQPQLFLLWLRDDPTVLLRQLELPLLPEKGILGNVVHRIPLQGAAFLQCQGGIVGKWISSNHMLSCAAGTRKMPIHLRSAATCWTAAYPAAPDSGHGRARTPPRW
jgi:hypothetical protein